MKRLLFALLMCSLDAFAQHVSLDVAIQVSTNHMRNIKRATPEVSYVNYKAIGNHLCLYEIVFNDSSWCFVPADMSVGPILAYGFTRSGNDNIPEAFLKLIEWYTAQLDTIIYYDLNKGVTHPSWEFMLESKYSSDYIVGGSLLDMTGRGRLCWSQGKNYDNGCSPSYNQDCPSTIIDCYACYHEPVGCAAVALGEIMWYWRWPESSEYNWDSMPSKLRNTTANDSASVLSRFLRECGEAVGMTYACTGSFATMDNIVDALINRYGYYGSHKIYKSDWGFGSSWNDIVKSEIDHKRPVLFYGDSWAFFEGHFFVVDGYQENYEGIFYHVNWGHGGNNNCFCRLDRIKEIQNGDTSYYDINNRAIVGISPTYCINQIISEVNYTKVPSGFSRNEFATDRVILPSLDNPLWVEPDGRLVIESGNEAILKDGFWAKRGSEVNVSIDEEWRNGMAISVPQWYNAIYMGDDGYKLQVVNADSWEFSLCDAAGVTVYQSAGSIGDDGVAYLWDGTNMNYGLYYGNIRFKNSYGRELLQNQFPICVLSRDSSDPEHSSKLDSSAFAGQYTKTDHQSAAIKIYPNPSDGIITVDLPTDTIFSIRIYNTQGFLVYTDDNIVQHRYTLNIASFPQGVYFVVVHSRNSTYSLKFFKQ